MPLIVGGDFNCVPCVQRDKFRGDGAFGDDTFGFRSILRLVEECVRVVPCRRFSIV